MATAFLDRVSSKALGQLLVEKGLLAPEQLDEALALGKAEDLRVGEALLKLGYITREALSYMLGEQYGIKPMELHPSMLDPKLVRRFPIEILQEHQVLPLIEIGDELVVVVSDPNDTAGLKELASLAPGYTIAPQLADAGQLRRCLETLKEKRQRPGGLTTPLAVPTECKLEPAVPLPTEVNFANWLIGTVLQEPRADLALRVIAGECVVSRVREQGGLDEIHRFPADSFNAVRDALLRSCVTVEHTRERAAAWNTSLRFAGRTFDMLVLDNRSDRVPQLRLRALERARASNEDSSGAPLLRLHGGTCSVVMYDKAAQLEDYLSELFLVTSGSQLPILIQQATRRSFEGVETYPAGLTDVPAAVAASGATCVVFDSVPAPDEVFRLCRAMLNAPAVVICAPLFEGQEARLSPDVDYIRQRLPGETIQLGNMMPGASAANGEGN